MVSPQEEHPTLHKYRESLLTIGNFISDFCDLFFCDIGDLSAADENFGILQIQLTSKTTKSPKSSNIR